MSAHGYPWVFNELGADTSPPQAAAVPKTTAYMKNMLSISSLENRLQNQS